MILNNFFLLAIYIFMRWLSVNRSLWNLLVCQTLHIMHNINLTPLKYFFRERGKKKTGSERWICPHAESEGKINSFWQPKEILKHYYCCVNKIHFPYENYEVQFSLFKICITFYLSRVCACVCVCVWMCAMVRLRWSGNNLWNSFLPTHGSQESISVY